MKKTIIAVLLTLATFGVKAQNTFPTTGNVGIGTTLPNSSLEVHGKQGTANSKNFRVIYPSGGNLKNTELSGLMHAPSLVGGNGWTALYAKQGAASKAAVMDGEVAVHGNVGIGTLSPKSSLEVHGKQGAANSKNFRVIYPSGGNLKNTELSGLMHAPSLVGGNGWTALYAKQGAASKAAVLDGEVAVHGNVGIGTLSPKSSLEVHGKQGAANSKNFRVIYPSGGNLKNTELSGLMHAPSLVGGNGWTALYAKQGAASKAAVLDGEVAVHGNVGIGTLSPKSSLEVHGKQGTANSKNFRVIYPSGGNLKNTELSGLMHAPSLVGGNGWTALYAKQGAASKAAVLDGEVAVHGNVGIGTLSPKSSLEVHGKQGTANSKNFRVIYPSGGNLKNTELSGLMHAPSLVGGNGWTALYAKQGAASKAAVLDGDVLVYGQLKSKEVIVTLDEFPDFVFESSYKLKGLNEVESFINENKHLPDVPSEKEVIENGINLGQMDAVLLQKIEELTLYLIEQNKSLTEQNKTQKELMNTIQSQQTEIKNLKKEISSLKK